MSGGAPLERHPAETYPYYWGGLSTNDLSGYWGIFYDSNVESMVLKHKKEQERADIIDTAKTPLIWYKLYPESDLNNIDVIKAVDIHGEEVPWDPTSK